MFCESEACCSGLSVQDVCVVYGRKLLEFAHMIENSRGSRHSASDGRIFAIVPSVLRVRVVRWLVGQRGAAGAHKPANISLPRSRKP